jgi:CheY-like chemotaxis protein
MKLQNMIEMKMLIVEDMEQTLQDSENYIHEIIEDYKRRAGIVRFKIDKATSIDEAIKKLTQNISSPYHLVLLDLHLPEPRTSQFETGGYVRQKTHGIFKGFEILEFIEETEAAESVIIVSGFQENLLDAFRKGASDFIIKPYEAEELQERVLICWSRLLLKKSQRILQHRISDLIPYAEEGLTRPFNTCFSGLIQAVAHSTRDIETYMSERYGLDRQKDSQDFLFRCLKLQEDSVAQARNEWKALQSALLTRNEPYGAETIETLLEDIHQKLLPCLIVKNVFLESPDDSATEILTFDNNVSAVLKEIIMGALDTLPDYNKTENSITINIETVSRRAKMSFIDQVEPISTEDAEKINEGLNVDPRRRFKRAWGLSIVQQIAIRGGGRLEIKPQSQGNIVTYFIPSAH